MKHIDGGLVFYCKSVCLSSPEDRGFQSMLRCTRCHGRALNCGLRLASTAVFTVIVDMKLFEFLDAGNPGQ